MQDFLSGLVSLHKIASRNGDGLIPELLELAQRNEELVRQGAVPLGVHAASSGPDPQVPTRQSLEEAGISILPTETGKTGLENTG